MRYDLAKRAGKRIPVEASSGNVFAHLGLPDAEDLDTKVRLAVRINRMFTAQRLNQVTAAARLNVSPPKISALKNYRLDGFSVERLIRFMMALGEDGKISSRPRNTAGAHGRLLIQGP
jgi:predicted XRE-type DNA-binding protein